MKRSRESDSESTDSETSPTINESKIILLKKIRNLYSNDFSSDVTLVVDGKSYPAHRFILSISSEVFETMLTNTRWNDSNQKVVELQEDPQCLEVFPIFLQYFYCGFIKLGQNNVLQVLMLADKYCVKELTVLCTKFMFRQISEAAEQGHLITWFQYILSLNQPIKTNDSYYCKLWQDPECTDIKPPWTELFKACRNFIKWNLNLCVKSFCLFQYDILIGLLKQSDLVLNDEMQLFGYVSNWLKNQAEVKLPEYNDSETFKNYMSSLTKHVMSNIRYPMMVPRLLGNLFILPIFKENKDFFVDKITTAMEYNLIKKEKQSNTEFLLECTPRLYTSNRWGHIFKICSKSLENCELFYEKYKTDSSLFEKEEVTESHWVIEFYFKGMYFDRAIYMAPEGFLELPDVLIETERAIIKLKLDQVKAGHASRHVRVAIMVYAVQNLIVHIATLIQKVVLFDSNEISMTIKDLLPYDVIDQETRGNANLKNSASVSYFMFDRTSLKFHVIITPIIPGLTDAHVDTRVQHVNF